MNTLSNTPRKSNALLVDLAGVGRMLGLPPAEMERIAMTEECPIELILVGSHWLYRAEDVRRWVRDGCPTRMRTMAGVGSRRTGGAQ